MRRDGHDIHSDTAYAICPGRSWQDVVALLNARWPAAFTCDTELIRRVEEEMDSLEGIVGEPIDDSIGALRELSSMCPVCIVTGSSRAHVAEAAKHIGIDQSIGFILGCEDYTEGKPAPTPFLAAADRLGVPPQACVVIEDSPAGAQGAKAAGMECVLLSPDSQPDPLDHGADVVVSSLQSSEFWRFLGCTDSPTGEQRHG